LGELDGPSGSASLDREMLRPRSLPSGFVPPCLPTSAPRPPSGEPWLNEIKHDGFRVIARKDGKRVKLYSRPVNDLTYPVARAVDMASGEWPATARFARPPGIGRQDSNLRMLQSHLTPQPFEITEEFEITKVTEPNGGSRCQSLPSAVIPISAR
jgi:hypothetical protein